MGETKRVCILGTAESWTEAPWDDPTIEIWGLNDGYSARDPKGMTPKRIDQHFDLHPIDRMWFRPKNKTTFHPGEIPEGVFVRPEGHLEWLKKQAQTIPVWLQADPPEGWPVNAKRFPYEAVKAFLRARPDQDAYIASSPSMMLAHAILQGKTEIHIYGIHLATQHEYIKQRPQFEHLLGRAMERGIAIHLPKSCPLLKHTHVYGYEPEPQRPDKDAVQRMKKAQREFSTLTIKLANWPRWKSKRAELARLARVQAEMKDAEQAIRHAQLTGVGG
jgi:hypothetical protein